MKILVNTLYVLMAVAAVVHTAASNAEAAEITAELSAHETYVGAPVRFQIQIRGATKVDPPAFPHVDGLGIKLLGEPARSSLITTISGRTTTSSSLTYTYEVTPHRSGSFQIPSVTVRADGADHTTQAVTLIASNSATGDLMLVEISGKQSQIFVGQALDLTLQIWLRPYHDRDYNLTLSESNMWNLVSDRSSWGIFADRLQQLSDNNERPIGKEVLRKDNSGAEHSYYLYEINGTIYPKRPGKIDASNIRVVVDYPTAIGKARDPFAGLFDGLPFPGRRPGMPDEGSPFSAFTSRLTVQSTRPIVAEATAPATKVLPIPTAGRPADYRGAVGKYLIVTEASPLSVKAGDPIELSIGIAGSGPMELVQAPPLADLPELTADFKVPSGPVAGFVKGDRKLFSITVRPRRADVTRIPAVPFSYFDPTTEKFATVSSDPIPVHVDPADTLALAAIVGHSNDESGSNASSLQSPQSPPSLPIFIGDDLLQAEPSHALNLGLLIALLVLPPLSAIAIVVLNSRESLVRFAAGFVSNYRRSRAQIECGKNPADFAAALQLFVQRQLRFAGEHGDAASTVGGLRAAGFSQLAIRCERVFDKCQHLTTFGAFTAASSMNLLKHDALQLLDDLRTGFQNQRPKPATIRRRLAKTALVLALVVGAVAGMRRDARAADEQVNPQTGASEISPSSSQLLDLTPVQQKLLLAEANECYRQGQTAATTDRAAAKESFVRAADKYLLLVESGISNSRLDANLANAYLESGQAEQAVTYYRRAIDLNPTNRDARANLAIAEQATHPTRARASSENQASSFVHLAGVVRWIGSVVSPLQIEIVMLFAWFGLWTAVTLRLTVDPGHWRMAATGSILLIAIAAAIVIGGGG